MEYGSWKSNPNFIFYQIKNSFFSNINYLEVACQLWKRKTQKKTIDILDKVSQNVLLNPFPRFPFLFSKAQTYIIDK